MAHYNYFIGKQTKTFDCPCGYRIHSSTERERDFKRNLHMRNCDRGRYITNTTRNIHHANTTSLNAVIDKSLKKDREQRSKEFST